MGRVSLVPQVHTLRRSTVMTEGACSQVSEKVASGPKEVCARLALQELAVSRWLIEHQFSLPRGAFAGQLSLPSRTCVCRGGRSRSQRAR